MTDTHRRDVLKAEINYWLSIAGDENAAPETRRMARKIAHTGVKLLAKMEGV